MTASGPETNDQNSIASPINQTIGREKDTGTDLITINIPADEEGSNLNPNTPCLDSGSWWKTALSQGWRMASSAPSFPPSSY